MGSLKTSGCLMPGWRGGGCRLNKEFLDRGIFGSKRGIVYEWISGALLKVVWPPAGGSKGEP
ncbi:unnamed protein product [Ilex paraguariensis]|uniref:Uncharacterized protein n=1 Tax=Ilex paraguariensis TaxID=185542 RepID=A0ABC8UA84_9AQUA